MPQFNKMSPYGTQANGFGIYLGPLRLDNPSWDNGPVQALFAARNDFVFRRNVSMFNFNLAQNAIAEFEEDGLRGRFYKTAKDLVKTIEDGTHAGQWFLPTPTMLQRLFAISGRDVSQTLPGNFYGSLPEDPRAKIDAVCFRPQSSRDTTGSIIKVSTNDKLNWRPFRIITLG